MLTPDELRQNYLDFCLQNRHAIIPSASLVPENDPTTLFTGSGMQPLLPYFLGQPHPKGKRVTDSQKCFRSQDIEEVGDNRHTTFFEMLGNWSFGDYFKKEQLRWFFTWLTKELKLDPNKLFVTVFAGDASLKIAEDQEAAGIWQELFKEVGIEAKAVKDAGSKGLQGGRIFFYPAKNNWWSRTGEPATMPAGEPGGPDSEVFYDFGSELRLHENSSFKDQPCHVNCDCGRFLEIGNSVFMQFKKEADGSFTELPQKNVDFGGGMERILAAVQNQPDVFQNSTFAPIIAQLEKLVGKKYASLSDQEKRSFRVMADHLKAAVMLAADGVYPGNKEQGYYARRLVRRAIRYGQAVGIERPFVKDLVQVVAELYAKPYPQAKAQQAKIETVLAAEEQKFSQALTKGLREFEKLATNAVFQPSDAFRFYETYGFPVELFMEMVQEKNLSLGKHTTQAFVTEFEQLKTQHAEQSRTASAGAFKGGLADHSKITTAFHTATHLLHAALRQVLGSEVQQKGSNITVERLRFDFAFPRALTTEEVSKVEGLMNQWISAKLPVAKLLMKKTDALKSGALAFFVERYPDEVSVYVVGKDPQGPMRDLEKGWISKELCGGPHVKNTSEIGKIEIIKEKAVAAGARRVYARKK